MDSTTMRMLAMMALLLSSLAMQVESKPSCSGKKFNKKDKLLAGNVASVLSLLQFQAQFALGDRVTKRLETPPVSGDARCSNKLSEKECVACLDVAIKDIKGSCRNAFSGRVSGNKCSIGYQVEK